MRTLLVAAVAVVASLSAAPAEASSVWRETRVQGHTVQSRTCWQDRGMARKRCTRWVGAKSRRGVVVCPRPVAGGHPFCYGVEL